MAYDPYRKGTLLIPTGGTKHLFVIATNRCANGAHLIVNITTVRGPNIDATCVLEAGCHRFVTGQSYAVYRMADIQSAERLGRMVDGWVYSVHDDASEELTQLVYDGVSQSRHTPKRILNYLSGTP